MSIPQREAMKAKETYQHPIIPKSFWLMQIGKKGKVFVSAETIEQIPQSNLTNFIENNRLELRPVNKNLFEIKAA